MVFFLYPVTATFEATMRFFQEEKTVNQKIFFKNEEFLHCHRNDALSK